ncbi:hypothetical protein [Streptomyces vietnamensis]|uniref:Uncharacterized protein n=1 Tax=Streptomyces vietnamensis TaxID=362257 RepID=A0A0B5ID64_9ACTN|nr:hypothetical protein [Streptomyces vietnamensis]AJF70451.1 hypothetical protein SVTN_40530 [Streptomyces vietnamensis]
MRHTIPPSLPPRAAEHHCPGGIPDAATLQAEVRALRQRLAVAEAALPGITQLTDGTPAELTVYRAGFNAIPYGTYTTREAARACCEDSLEQHRPIPEGASTFWVPQSGDEDASEELVLFGPGPDDEDSTGMLVHPQAISVLYTPDAEG